MLCGPRCVLADDGHEEQGLAGVPAVAAQSREDLHLRSVCIFCTDVLV